MEKELFLPKVVFGVGSTVITYLFGGWSVGLGVLVFLIVFDYVTGLIAAFYEDNLSSKEGMKGIIKKFLMVLLVAMANQLDLILNSPGFLINITIFFFVANEGLSILENAARLGVPFPYQIKNALVQIRKRTDVHAEQKELR